MPSVRFGYILSSKANVSELNKIRGPYAVNQLSVVAAKAALEDPTYMQEYVEEIRSVSKPMFENFLNERAIEFWPSAANYYLVRFSEPKQVEMSLRSAGIRVRPKPDNHDRPWSADYSRS
jgi:histidinol-phosphate aminotransferase